MNDPETEQDPGTPRVGVVEVFTKTGCRPCKQTLRWLRKHGVAPDVYPAKEFFDVLVPLGIGQHQAAQAMYPTAVFVVGGCDFHHHIAELFAGSHAAEGVAVQWQGMVVAIAQGKAFGVRLGIGAQFLDLADPMHGQRRFIGPQNGLVDLGQNHTVGQPGDDGLQLAAVGFFGENILGHNVSD